MSSACQAWIVSVNHDGSISAIRIRVQALDLFGRRRVESPLLYGARFDVQISSTARTARGDDAIEFLFAPNVGEGSVPIRQCASGGELSRVLLALKTALAGLELTPTLVFDEIDANIGGQTGTLVGQKLKSIATKRQVLCITHLSQVAREADHHFHICKSESGGRTHSTVTHLDSNERETELTRMVGLVV